MEKQYLQINRIGNKFKIRIKQLNSCLVKKYKDELWFWFINNHNIANDILSLGGFCPLLV